MLAGAICALIGIAIGFIETRLIAPVVIAKLRALETDASPQAVATFERKIGLFRIVFLLINVVFGAVAGYTIGRLVFG